MNDALSFEYRPPLFCRAVEMTDRRKIAAVAGDRVLRGPYRSSPHVRRVLTRVLFLACFGIGDFSVLHGRHAMASQRLAMGPASSHTHRSSVSPPRQNAPGFAADSRAVAARPTR